MIATRRFFSLAGLLALAAGGALPACALPTEATADEDESVSEVSSAATGKASLPATDLPGSIPTITTDGTTMAVARTPKSKSYPSGLSAVRFGVSTSGEYSAKVVGKGPGAEVYAYLLAATPVDGNHAVIAKLTWRADLGAAVTVNQDLSKGDYILAFRDASYRKGTSFEVGVARENRITDLAAAGGLVCSLRSTGTVACAVNKGIPGPYHPVPVPPIASAAKLRSKSNAMVDAIIAETPQGTAHISEDRTVTWLAPGVVDQDGATANVEATASERAYTYRFDCTISGRSLTCDGATATASESLQFVRVKSFSYTPYQWDGSNGSIKGDGYVVGQSGAIYPWSFVRSVPGSSTAKRQTTFQLSAKATERSTMVHDSAIVSETNVLKGMGYAFLPPHTLTARPLAIGNATYLAQTYERQWAVLYADGRLDVLGTQVTYKPYTPTQRTPAVLTSLTGVTVAAAGKGTVCGSDGAWLKCLDNENEWYAQLSGGL